MATIKLNNWITIPAVWFWTWLIPDDKVAEPVKIAIKLWYRLIDTAQIYMNEEWVWKWIRECWIPREELFITSKVTAFIKNYEEAKKSIDESLEKMGLDYLDLMIIHAPQPWNEFRTSENQYYKENLEVWRALEEAYKEWKLKAIGVSNFHNSDLQNIIDNCEIKPMVNQVLSHAGQTPFEIIDFCKKNDIVVEAYSPIAHWQAGRIKEVVEMAEKYGKSISQICIKHQLQLGLVVLPKATSEAHIKENFDLDFEISEEDMNILNNAKPLEDYWADNHFEVFKYSWK